MKKRKQKKQQPSKRKLLLIALGVFILLLFTSFAVWIAKQETKSNTEAALNAFQPLGVGGNWDMIFSDEFDETSLNTANWATQEPWNTPPGFTPPDGTSHGGWCPIPLSVDNDLVVENGGTLKLNAKARPTNGKEIQACMITSRNKHDFTQGYFETRVKIPGGADLWPSFWLLGNKQWPTGGEIDVFEFVNNGRDNGVPFSTVHYGGPCSADGHCMKTQNSPYPAIIPDYTSHFITFGLLRTQTELKFYVDGQLKHTFTSSDKNDQGITLAPELFNAPAHLRFDLEVGEWADNPNLPAQEGSYEIDYVRVWTPGAAPTVAPTATPAPSPTNTPTPTLAPTATPTIKPTVAPITELIQNGSFENGLTPWVLQVTSPARATIARYTTEKISGNYAALFDIAQSSPNNWYAQFKQSNITLVAGKIYTLSFWAKGSHNRSMQSVLQQNSAPYKVLSQQTINLTNSWKKFTYNYQASGNDNAFLGFNAAQEKGHIWFDDISLKSN